MRMTCAACGIEKDTAIKEIFPYPEDGMIDEPIDPFLVVVRH